MKGIKRFAFFGYRVIKPILDPLKLILSIPRYLFFFRDLRVYSKMKGSEKINMADIYPCIHNKTETTRFDPHYFYQDIWAFKKIRDANPEHHVDVGSRIDYVGFLTAITNVEFIDIRPLAAQLDGFSSKKGSILSMPFEDNSVRSISCLHVAEHIGLGRYGDKLNTAGTKKACKELSRILEPGGNLYFSLPVGIPRLCFNAHRIHSPRRILRYFEGLELVEFSGVDDKKNYRKGINLDELAGAEYACGFFHFTKK